MKLYHHGSSACAAKVRLALAEKKLGWEGHYVDILAGEQFEPDFVAVNPKAVVPVLIHDGNVIPESTVICEYLDEVFPEQPLYPRHPYERACVRIWTKAVDEELHPACSAVTYVTSHRHTILRNGAGSFEEFLERGGTDGATARARKWRWIQEGLSAPGVADQFRLYEGYLRKMEDALAGSEWLVGGQFSMADVAMAPYLFRLVLLSMDELWRGGRLPRVESWYERISERTAFRGALVDWMPAELAAEMRENGRKSWPEVKVLLESR